MENTKTFDPQFIEQLAELDPDLPTNLIGLYKTGLAEDLKTLHGLSPSSQREIIKKIAHRAKSSNANLGLLKMTELLQRLEDDGYEDADYFNILADIEKTSVLALEVLNAYLKIKI